MKQLLNTLLDYFIEWGWDTYYSIKDEREVNVKSEIQEKENGEESWL